MYIEIYLAWVKVFYMMLLNRRQSSKIGCSIRIVQRGRWGTRDGDSIRAKRFLFLITVILYSIVVWRWLESPHSRINMTRPYIKHTYVTVCSTHGLNVVDNGKYTAAYIICNCSYYFIRLEIYLLASVILVVLSTSLIFNHCFFL